MNNFMKGMTTGLVVGVAATAVMMPKSNKSKKAMKSTTGKALKAVGGLIDNFQSMMD